MFDLTGKTAIVTGAAHGIGRAIAEVFAEAGASVVLVDVDEAAGFEAARAIRGATFHPADVSSPEDARRVVRAAADATGRIDVLVNNAAYLDHFHDMLNASAQEWEQSFRVSVLGAVNFSREVLPLMQRQQGGSIINVSSVQGLVGARDSAPYTTMKTALVGMTRSVACDYGKYGIRANALCPGAITTRISPKPGEALYARQVGHTMLQRVGKPLEVAYAALFLAADESAYVTGAVLPVDGGWTAM